MVYENLCINCMKKKASSDKICPHCGFDAAKYNISDFQLPPYTGLSDGRYIIGKVLGSGGFGITYIAFDTRLEVPVAIKELFVANKVKRQHGKTVLMDTTENGIREYKEMKRRFMQEAKTMAELENVEGVVKVKDYFSENDTAYIVMEYLDGKTLKEIVRENKKRMSVTQAVTLFEPVMHSLSKMHKAGIIHRDISLDNIMVTRDRRVKLIDLGGEKRLESISDTDKTIAIKKSVYTPVEQILGKSSSIGPWTDVYALAVTIYRCICGRFPKASGERENDRDIEKPSKLGVHITRKQEETLLKALALDRKNRIQSVDQLLAGLKREKKTNKWPFIITMVVVIGIITGKSVQNQVKHLEDKKDDVEIETSTEKTTETEPETQTEKLTETEPETQTEKPTETEAETQTEKSTETEPETQTEKPTETESETQTEKPTEAESETNGTWYYISSTYKDGIAVRSEPTGESEQLTRLPYGTEFCVEKTEKNWGYTTIDGVSGWVALDYAHLLENAEASAWYYIRSTYKDGIAVRSEPTGESEQLTRLPYGTEFYVEKTEKNWGYTTINGVSGWIALDYASLLENEPSEVWYRITSTYKKGIAVRSEPTGESEQLTRLPYGTEFYVEKTEKNWGYTTIDGVSGWVALDYAEVIEKEEASAIGSETVNKKTEDIQISNYDQALFYQQCNNLQSAKAGDVLKFGEYEQDNNPSNGKEQIEWEVLDKSDDKLLLISRKGLCCYPFFSEYENTTWADSDMRSRLNETFYQDAFSAYHQRMILDTEVTADKNPDYTTDPGESTTDKIYLLSIDEAKKYFSSQAARVCQPTVYAKVQGTYLKDGNGWWWMRTPGRDGKHVSLVYTDGEIRSIGYRTYVKGTVRPVMWLDVSEITQVEVPEELLEKQTECKGIVAIDPSCVGTPEDRTYMEAVAPGQEEKECSFNAGVTGETTGVKESLLNLEVAKQLQGELLERGYQVVMLREDQESRLSPSNRAIAAAESGADILIVISCRKRQDLGERGAMAYIPRRDNPNVGYMYEECSRLAQSVLNKYCAKGIFENNGIHETDNAKVINWSSIPVVNMLMGCITDSSDEARLADQNNWESMAEGMADGIDAYFSS